jgi:hypothetical protein
MSYYDVEMVDTELQCPICKEILEDPRLLPCGYICCLKCIISQFNENDDYKCKCCENIHEKKDANKHPIPKLVSNLLQKTKNKISPKFIELKFKEELEKFKKTIDCFDDKQKNFKSNLSDYCGLLRAEIMIETQCIIKNLNKHCDEMCKIVDHYEDEKKFEWYTNKNDECKTLINENCTIHQNMTELYNKQTVEVGKIEEAIQLMKQNSIRIENESIKISNNVFNLKYFKNNEKKDFKSIIGQIFNVEKNENEYFNLKRTSERINETKSKKVYNLRKSPSNNPKKSTQLNKKATNKLKENPKNDSKN